MAAGRPFEDSFALAVACGAAALITPGTEMCQKEDVDRLYAELRASASPTVQE
jgi:6-phosphofructokinase 2